MKLKSIPLMLLPALMLLVACGGGTDPVPAQPTPNIASTAEAGVKATAIATVETMIRRHYWEHEKDIEDFLKTI